MKVLVINANVFPVPLVGYGGLEQIAYHVALGLAQKGHKVTLAAAKGSTVPDTMELIATGDPPAGQRFEPEQVTWGRYRERLEKGEWDAIIDMSWEKWSYLSSMARDPQLPIIGVLHSDEKIYNEPPPVRWPCFMGLSQSHALRIKKHFRIDARYCYNGVDLDFYKRDTAVIRQRRFLALGRYTVEKGMLQAINIARKLRLGLDCVGDTEIVGGFDYVERCRAACDGLQIRFMPGVSRAETVKLYQAHEAMLFPLQWEEPFGLTVVEANACGLPVITLRRGSMPELIEHGKNGFILDDEEEMAAFLAKGPDYGQVTPETCRAAAERFSIQRMVDGYEKLAQDAAGGYLW